MCTYHPLPEGTFDPAKNLAEVFARYGIIADAFQLRNAFTKDWTKISTLAHAVHDDVVAKKNKELDDAIASVACYNSAMLRDLVEAKDPFALSKLRKLVEAMEK